MVKLKGFSAVDTVYMPVTPSVRTTIRTRTAHKYPLFGGFFVVAMIIGSAGVTGCARYSDERASIRATPVSVHSEEFRPRPVTAIVRTEDDTSM